MSLYPHLPQEDSTPSPLDSPLTHSLLPVCSVCLEDYNESKRPPKYLSCHHTFCEECIHQLVRARGEVECPLCRQVTTLSSHQVLQTNNDVLTMAKYGNMIVNLWCEDCGSSPKSTCDAHNVINKAAVPKHFTLAEQLGSTMEAWQPTVVRVVETAQGWGVVAADVTYSTITTVGEYVAPLASYISEWFTQALSSLTGSDD